MIYFCSLILLLVLLFVGACFGAKILTYTIQELNILRSFYILIPIFTFYYFFLCLFIPKYFIKTFKLIFFKNKMVFVGLIMAKVVEEVISERKKRNRGVVNDKKGIIVNPKQKKTPIVATRKKRRSRFSARIKVCVKSAVDVKSNVNPDAFYVLCKAS